MGVHPRQSRGPSAMICMLALLVAVGRPDLSAAVSAPVGQEPQRIDLINDMPAAGDLAAPANGQTLYILDEARGDVIAIDPFEPARRWTAVAANGRADGGADPVAIACIDTGTLALLCRTKATWSLQAHRVQPGITADLRKPSQNVPFRIVAGTTAPAGATPASADPTLAEGGLERACLTVSPSRDWLAVCGLPSPLPTVMRAPIAGARIGDVTPRDCPELLPGVRLSASTISKAEELVLFARDPTIPTKPAVFVSFYLPPDPRRLLYLDTTLPRIRDAAFCRADGTLWVVGGEPDTGKGSATAPDGLWRIDAILRNGRQSARAVCVARLDGARAVTCLSERAIIVTHGRESRVVSRIDPTHTNADPKEPAAADIDTKPSASQPQPQAPSRSKP